MADYNGLLDGHYYMYDLTWLVRQIKEQGAQIASLPDQIKAWIAEGLSDLEINKLILEALTQYGMAINVLAPPAGLTPATADGTTDSTAAIQGCLDYAARAGGKVVFFPYGQYLTQPLTVSGSCALVGFDARNTTLFLAQGAQAPLLTVRDWEGEISGLTLDANAANQVDAQACIRGAIIDGVMRDVTLTNGTVGIDVTGGKLYTSGLTISAFTDRAIAANLTGADVTARLESYKAANVTALLDIGGSGGVYHIVATSAADVLAEMTGSNNSVMAKLPAFMDINDSGTGNYFHVDIPETRKEEVKNWIQDVTGDLTESAGSRNTTIGENHWFVHFPDRTVDLHGSPFIFSSLPGETDTVKLQYAFDHNLPVTLDRDISIGAININSDNQYVYGAGHTINMAGEIATTGTYINTVSFVSCRFNGAGGGWFTPSINLTLVNFIDCTFQAFTHNIFVGDEMQSWNFTNCLFGWNSCQWCIDIVRADACEFISCNVENSGDTMYSFFRNSTYIYQSSFIGCVVENINTAFSLVGCGNLLIEGLYLEGNDHNIIINKDYLQSARIANVHCNIKADGNQYVVECTAPSNASMYGPLVLDMCDSNANVASIAGTAISNIQARDCLAPNGKVLTLLTPSPDRIRTTGVYTETLSFSGVYPASGQLIDIPTNAVSYGHWINCAIVASVDNGSEVLRTMEYYNVIVHQSRAVILKGDGATTLNYKVTLFYN